ncbi:MAG: dicarboxylate/amino acid:cation symporter [Vampirovibrionales bacterium]|nr:dicarboxylate/amino acid:cation symporter [Vampirovibrionales bacterium]
MTLLKSIKMPSLVAQVILAMVLGVLFGWWSPHWINFGVTAPEWNTLPIPQQIQPLSTAFLNMIKMLIAPLLFSTLVVGIAGGGGHKTVGRIGVKTIFYFEAATTIALVIGLFIANWLQPGVGIDISLGADNADAAAKIAHDAQALASTSFLDTIAHMFPTSIVKAMAEGEILQLVVFAVFFALALSAAGEKGKPVLHILESLSEVMFKFVAYVMAFAPMGVFAAISFTVSKNGLEVLAIFAKLAGALYLALALFVMLVLFTVCQICRIPILQLMKAIRDPFFLAFSTASSEAAMPKAMEVMNRFGVPKGIVSFVMPTGYSFNLDGSTLYLSLATLFVAQMAGIDLPIGKQIMIVLTLMLTSKGVAAVPRASLVILAGTLTAFGLPIEGIGLILGIDHILDMGRTSVNLLGNCVATAVVARWEGVLDDEKMRTFDRQDNSVLEDDENDDPGAAQKQRLKPLQATY